MDDLPRMPRLIGLADTDQQSGDWNETPTLGIGLAAAVGRHAMPHHIAIVITKGIDGPPIRLVEPRDLGDKRRDLAGIGGSFELALGLTPCCEGLLHLRHRASLPA